MGWERRGKEMYYYISERRDGRVRKVYVGKGRIAAMAAANVAKRRELRIAEKAQVMEAATSVAAADQATELLSRECESLLAAMMVLAGFHQENGRTWRKRREPKSTTTRTASHR